MGHPGTRKVCGPPVRRSGRDELGDAGRGASAVDGADGGAAAEAGGGGDGQEGSSVAVRYTERGRSAKAFRGIGPTGKTYEVLAIEWFEFEGGKIVRRWGARDFRGDCAAA